MPQVVWQAKYVRCGKERCRCMRGGEPHGPYWYAYWAEGPKTGCRYKGKPGDVDPPPRGDGPHRRARSEYQDVPPPPPPPRRRKARQERPGGRRRQAPPPPPPPPPPGGQRREAPPPPRGLGVVGGPQDQADAATLGVSTGIDRAGLKSAWRAKIAAAHPDRAGAAATARAQAAIEADPPGCCLI